MAPRVLVWPQVISLWPWPLTLWSQLHNHQMTHANQLKLSSFNMLCDIMGPKVYFNHYWSLTYNLKIKLAHLCCQVWGKGELIFEVVSQGGPNFHKCIKVVKLVKFPIGALLTNFLRGSIVVPERGRTPFRKILRSRNDAPCK